VSINDFHNDKFGGKWPKGTAPLYEATSSQKRSGMARVVKRSHSFTHAFIANRPLPSQPKAQSCFPAKAGPHLLTPKRWKAELA